MIEGLMPEVKTEMKPMNDVATSGENLLKTSTSTATELRDVVGAMGSVQKDGVLGDEEKDNTNPYSENEMKAMGVEDKRAFLAELQTVAKEKGPKFAMELQKSIKEGKLSWIGFQRGETERKLQEKMKAFSEKKAVIEASRDTKTAKAKEKYEKDDEKAQRKSKNKVHKLAVKLKKNSTTKEFRQNMNVVDDYFQFQRTDEVSRGIMAKRDEVKVDPNVADLITQIKEQNANSKADRDSRKQELLAELAAIDAGSKQELGQLKSSTIQEVQALKKRLSELEEQQYKLEDELVDLEDKIADRERLQGSVDTLQDELREFSFADSKKVISGMEDRAANTLSIDALSVDKDNLNNALDSVTETAAKLEDELEIAMSQVESEIETSYQEQAATLQSEKDNLLNEKQGVHDQLIKSLNEPFAAAIEKMREASDLREGSTAIEIVSMFSGMGGQAVKAEKQLGKSAGLMEKFKTNLEKRFNKLGSKLDKSKAEAQMEADSRFDAVGETIANAQKLANEAKQDDFSGVQEAWFNRVWKKLVG